MHLETGVTMAHDRGVAAWCLRLEHWGRCGQGEDDDERGALADLAAQLGTGVDDLEVVERVHGDEQAFTADLAPVTPAHREVTLAVLAEQRACLLGLLDTTPAELLDQDPAWLRMPGFARWRTLRQRAWHVADAESRYYLPTLGLSARAREPDLREELAASAEHVARAVREVPPAAVNRQHGQVWSTGKLLRRLAWHERGELAAMLELRERLLADGDC